MYRIKDDVLQVLLAHPGGPYFAKKDDGSWTIPKGEPDGDEDLLVAAQREFEEETGIKPSGDLSCEADQAERRKNGPRLGLPGRL